MAKNTMTTEGGREREQANGETFYSFTPTIPQSLPKVGIITENTHHHIPSAPMKKYL